jgi:streptogramin lyase
VRVRKLLPVPALIASVLAASPSQAAAIAPGDLLMPCAYWGITRIDPVTGEQKPIGVGNSGALSPIAVDENGLVWVVDNRWVVSIDPETGDHHLVVQLPEDFVDSNDGELLAEPGGTLLHAGDGVLSRIDPTTGDLTPVAAGPPLVSPRGLDFAPNGDVWIADYGAGAIFRWNEDDGVQPVSSGDLLVGPTRVRQLADGDLFVLRVGLPLRVDPDTGAQSVYSATIGAVGAVDVASNGDLIYASVAAPTTPQLRRLSGPGAQPAALLDAGPTQEILSLPNLALTSDDRVVLAGIRQEFTDGVNTDDQGAIWLFDPASSSLRVLSARPPPGATAMSADGVLYVANTNGTAFNLRAVDPRTGETRRVSAGNLINRPVDAIVEADGRVLLLNGIPNGTPSVVRIDPETGDQTLLSPTGQLSDPERIALTPNGHVYLGDQNALRLIAVDPGNGAQSGVPGAGTLSFWGDLEGETSGSLLVLQQAVNRLVRVDPTTGDQQPVGPPIGPLLSIGLAPGPNSALEIDLDGTPWVTLGASTAIDGLYRAPLDAAEIEQVSELPLCTGNDLEVVPAPEPSGDAARAVAFAGLALLARYAGTRAVPRARRRVTRRSA